MIPSAPFIECTEDGVINHDIVTGHLQFELNNACPARGNEGRLHILSYDSASLDMHTVKDFANHVE